MRVIGCVLWGLHLGVFEHYEVRGSMLFRSRRGTEWRVLSFCIDDPEQGPVVMLPIMQREGLGEG